MPLDLRPFPAPDEAEESGEPALPDPPRELQDLFKGDIPEDPWQHQRYDPDNKVWQAAAMRKRAHYRRTNVSLGVCTVDLSGPHEPSPRPGKQLHRDTVSYFLVLTLRPDQPPIHVEAATQTDIEAEAIPEMASVAAPGHTGR